MTQAQHTPGDLEIYKHGTESDPSCVVAAGDILIAQTLGGNDEANAEYIIRAWKAHDKLVDACQGGLLTICLLLQEIDRLCTLFDLPPFPHPSIDGIKQALHDAGAEAPETLEEAMALASPTVAAQEREGE